MPTEQQRTFYSVKMLRAHLLPVTTEREKLARMSPGERGAYLAAKNVKQVFGENSG